MTIHQMFCRQAVKASSFTAMHIAHDTFNLFRVKQMTVGMVHQYNLTTVLSYVACKLRDSFVFSAVQIFRKCLIKLSTIKLWSKWPSTLTEVPVFVSNLAFQHLQNSLPSLYKSSSCKSLEYRSFVSACARRIASL